MVGRDALTQIEAVALLHAIGFLQAGDWLSEFRPQERRALDSAKRKIFETNNIAARHSVPKGLDERPEDAPTIWDVPVGAPMQPGWLPHYKPLEETHAVAEGRPFSAKVRRQLRKQANQGKKPAKPKRVRWHKGKLRPISEINKKPKNPWKDM